MGMVISSKFREAIQSHPLPLYMLGVKAGFHPSRLSKLMHGLEVKRPHDIRYGLLADSIGYDGEYFEGGQ